MERLCRLRAAKLFARARDALSSDNGADHQRKLNWRFILYTLAESPRQSPLQADRAFDPRSVRLN